MKGLAWINGNVGSLEHATISLHDRGYLFGDGVYELIKIYNGRPYTLTEHIQRLEHSLNGIRIKVDFSMEKWTELITDLVAQSKLKDAYVYIQVTRGVCPRLHHFSSDLRPSIVIYVCEMSDMEKGIRENGVSAITVPDERWSHPHLKTVNLIPNVLAKQSASEAGAYEALFIDAQRNITEGSSSNVFAVFENRLVTPACDGKILGGITRLIIQRLCQENGILLNEESLSYERLLLADEIFISSTGREIIGIVKLDGKIIGDGQPGPITKKIFDLYMQDINQSVNPTR